MRISRSIPWLSIVIVISVSLVTPIQAAASRDDPPRSPTLAPAVLTQWGYVRGIDSAGTYAYLGVPFAKPPVASLRWMPPVDPEPWPGELLTQAYPPKCPQRGEGDIVVGDEDCLYLNVWTPTDAVPDASLPVMVFLHGGGNSSGSTSDTIPYSSSSAVFYDGQPLTQFAHQVIVTVQYRLGALGFLAHPGFAAEHPDRMVGNYGLLDQIKALEWVRDNIDQFGGDPNQVLLFGESAGALDTCMLMISPLAAGLFHRALMESGGCFAEQLPIRYAEGQEFTAAVGCDASPDPLACLRSTPATTLVTAVDTASIQNGLVTMAFGPTIDGVTIPLDPMTGLSTGRFNRMPFVIGANADEMLPFVPSDLTVIAYQAAVHTFLDPFGPGYADQALSHYPVGGNPGSYPTAQRAFAALTTDAQFVCPARRIARAVDGSQTEPVFRYFFTQALRTTFFYDFSAFGAFHGLELAFVFRRLNVIPYYFPSSEELTLQDAIGGYWARFAASGDPNGGGAVLWPEYVSASDPYLDLKYSIASGEGVRTVKCDFWDTLPTYRNYLPVVNR